MEFELSWDCTLSGNAEEGLSTIRRGISLTQNRILTMN
jgi:hypothetical protein